MVDRPKDHYHIHEQEEVDVHNNRDGEEVQVDPDACMMARA